MGLTIYYMPLCPPCRGVLLTASAIGIDLDLKKIDVFKKEHLTPEYLSINIRHIVPAIDDNGFILNESRAIMRYLANKFAPESDLYPKDLQKRAKVDEFLCFDMELSARFKEYAYPAMFGTGPLLDENRKKYEECLAWLDGFLKANGGWAAGDKMTIADCSGVSAVSSHKASGLVDFSKYENVEAWLKRCKEEMPGYEEFNEKGLQEYKDWALEKIAAAKEKSG